MLLNEFFREFDSLLTEICGHYEKTAPTVSEWADDVYRRVSKQTVLLAEIKLAYDLMFAGGDKWPCHPNHAANQVYRLRERLGQDTTGNAGF